MVLVPLTHRWYIVFGLPVMVTENCLLRTTESTFAEIYTVLETSVMV